MTDVQGVGGQNILKQQIAGLLKTKYIGRSLYCFEKLGSTNDFLKNAAKELPDGCTAVTTQQLAGRGRRGNKWIAPKGQMAAISVLLKGRIPVTASSAVTPPITLMCGLAVANALKDLCGRKFLIKWPNDIVCDGKKVCGILCESKLIDAGCFTVCGIGVNLTQSPEFFINAGIPHGASLEMLTGKSPEACQVVAAILNHFEKIYNAVSGTKSVSAEQSAAEAFFADYNAICVTLGREIKAITGDGEIRGVAQAVNADGSLKVLSGGKTVTLLAGDCSVRGVMGYV